MSDFSRKLLQLLASRYAVSEDFATPLMPLFERFEESEASREEWEELLLQVASAYHATRRSELRSLDEVSALVDQVVGELQKMDESLKVLTAYLERLRQQVQHAAHPRVVH